MQVQKALNRVKKDNHVDQMQFHALILQVQDQLALVLPIEDLHLLQTEEAHLAAMKVKKVEFLD
jgi:hypothetical protein